jgi:uncharacterized protein (DUF4415 family)
MKNDSIGNITTVNQTDWEKVKAMTDTDIIHDADSPATTEADWAQAFVSHSVTELHTEAVRRICNTNESPVKEQVAIGFDADVLAYFRTTGEDWKNRINDALKEWLKEHAA